MEYLTVIICGGRTYQNYTYLKERLDNAPFTIARIISGGAKGADALGERYAREHEIPLSIHAAEWDKHGLSAGPIRNQKMLDENPDIVIALPGGKGTAHMIKIAKAKNTKVWEL